MSVDYRRLYVLESQIDKLQELVDDLERQLEDATTRGDEAERLLTECWWAFYKADPAYAQLFKMTEEEGMAMFV